jgi:hypothetical protein
MIADPEGPSFITRTVGRRRYADDVSVSHDPDRTNLPYGIECRQGATWSPITKHRDYLETTRFATAAGVWGRLHDHISRNKPGEVGRRGKRGARYRGHKVILVKLCRIAFKLPRPMAHGCALTITNGNQPHWLCTEPSMNVHALGVCRQAEFDLCVGGALRGIFVQQNMLSGRRSRNPSSGCCYPRRLYSWPQRGRLL